METFGFYQWNCSNGLRSKNAFFIIKKIENTF